MSAKKNVKTKKNRIKKVIDQAREPFSLLETLKEEGLASAVMLLGMAGNMASGATKNLRFDHVRPHLKDLVQQLGFAFRSDLDALEERVEELEDRLSSMEAAHHENDEE